ncbi:ubiquitin carboxyl-terminal hydrolase 48-like [Physella acuta]|uniref:ubiquitin carboxyl-terminal hydrolase 48-like n=1 Tax=Physella acuta TaxID=109671 RepID=UPI0027DB369F|nr:ubiquitin carboxyl-terminal hydrolase 48-like [Physella acuta]XP_059143218.1 ubiquitin carboxyl-terminal hydrolase 48-like [Physella acuta]
MPPKHKVQLDKGAWQWAETTDYTQVTEEHVKMAYRLNLSTCERASCKRNCKGNPFCLNNLGEKKWYGTVDETKWQNFDPDVERRQKGHFVGLKNLGATCYVNTFLQLWFHNPIIRRAVYEWREQTLPEEYYDDWKPDSICGHLQVMFALLQLSNRCFVDPSPLIECIGLDTGEQQDAQEFSKLFLHHLERSLSTVITENENVIVQQFCGRYCYVTICQNCKSESETPATFYELDLNIRGHSTLAASIKDFLQEEKLEGDNQYMCSVCNSKQNATRAIRLNKLPPVLNLQLLRFVFDKNKGHKKKLSSFIQFPETLDMSPYLQTEDVDEAVYELTAVLIHRGPTAYSGHYIAHIREQDTGAWYKYNDEEIEKMNNKKLELGKEEDVLATENTSEKAPKASKGNHSSRNAYMLVYRRQKSCNNGDLTNISEELLPAAVRGYVERDNQDFEGWIKEMLDTQEQNISEVKQTHEEMRALYSALPVKSLEEPWEWVTLEWLTKWLAEPAKIDQVSNRVPKCQHDKLPPDDVVKMKCISKEGAGLLFTRYPIDKRYEGESLLCEKCIRQRCREMRFRLCMSDDDKLFSSSKNISILDPGEEYFWVSTKHLRSWKKYAMEEIAIHPVASSSSLNDDTHPSSGASSDQEASSSSASSSCNLNNSSQEEQNICVPCDYPPEQAGLAGRLAAVLPASDLPVNSSHLDLKSPENNTVQSSPRYSKSSEIMNISPDLSPPSRDAYNTKITDANAMHGSHKLWTNSSENLFRNTTLSPKGSPSDNGGIKDSTFDEDGMDDCESPESGTIVLKKTMPLLENTVSEKGIEELSLEGQSGRKRSNGMVDNEDDQEGSGEEGRKDCLYVGEKEEKFNDDILCEHGNLRIDESGRRAVSKTVWDRLVYYFPHLKPFNMSSSVCEECLSHQLIEQQKKEDRKLAGQGQKDDLQNLYHMKNRPKIGDSWEERTAYVVSANFVDGWRKFVKHSVKSESVQEIVNAPLLCEHNLLLYKPEDMNAPDNATRFTLVWDEEWQKLTRYFAFDEEIQVMQFTEADGSKQVVTLPGVCSTCLNERIRQEEEGKFIFSRQTIYVRKVLDGSNSEINCRGDEPKENGKGYNYDPEFNAPPHQKPAKCKSIEPPPEKMAKLDTVAPRKSSRHRKTRGEKELVVSSNMTLKELKIQLYNLCSVPPFDQNLSLDGRCLKNDELTLQDLKVYPQCVIFLKADEPTETAASVEDFLSVPTRPEEGFKGTNLLGR